MEDLPQLAQANAALRTLGVDLEIAAQTVGADLVHSHTWYANFAGHISALLNDIPHVITAHSLEPLRPWKAEQLGGGYRVSSFIERSAYEAAAGVVAVSHGMREDILRAYPAVDPDRVHVIHNGIDLSQWHVPTTPLLVALLAKRDSRTSCALRVCFLTMFRSFCVLELPIPHRLQPKLKG